MCCASLSAADFASPEGYLGPSASTPYYPTGDLQGDRDYAYASAMHCSDALDVLLAVNDRTKVAAKQSELAQSLSDLGLHEYALMTSNSALELVRDMYAAESDDFRLRVASIQALRASILVDLKKNEEAVGAADEAISLYREHGRYQGVSVPELAYTCLDYAVLLSSVGLREESASIAVELLNEADEIGQDNDFLSSLGQLCLSNAQIGIDDDIALSAAEKAIEYCRTQSDVDVRAVLAGALLTKSKILSTQGRDDEACSFSLNAMVLLHGIREERPVFSLILAHALDTSSHQLLEASRKRESYLVAREAVEVWEALRVAAPGPVTRPLAWALFHLAKFRQKDAQKETFRQELLTSGYAVRMFSEASTLDAAGLADALYLFSDRLFEHDKKHHAAIFAEQSVRYFQQAASQAPEKHSLDLIFSLSLASSCLASVARADDALEYAKRAVAIQRERVGAVGYDAQLRKLLTDVVLRFTEAGRQEEAVTWIQELQALGETRGIGGSFHLISRSDSYRWSFRGLDSTSTSKWSG
jgi:tetratricopeptide (TPR) repeat protein